MSIKRFAKFLIKDSRFPVSCVRKLRWLYILRVAKIGVAQVGTKKFGAAEVGTSKVCTTKVRSAKFGSTKIGIA